MVSKCCIMEVQAGKEEVNTLWGNQGGKNVGTEVKGRKELSEDPEVTWCRVRLAVSWFKDR